eukprot:scaffold5901_cov116-Cylindrotheca_fusiformis.AAC.8
MKRGIQRTYSPRDVFDIAAFQEAELQDVVEYYPPNVESNDSEDGILELFERPGIYLQMLGEKGMLSDWRKTQYLAYTKQKKESKKRIQTEMLDIATRIRETEAKTRADVSLMREEMKRKKKKLRKSHKSKLAKIRIHVDQSRNDPYLSVILRSHRAELSKLLRESEDLKNLRNELKVMIAEEKRKQRSLELAQATLTNGIAILTTFTIDLTKENKALQRKETRLKSHLIPKFAREIRDADIAIKKLRESKKQTVSHLRKLVNGNGSHLPFQRMKSESCILEPLLAPIIEDRTMELAHI